MTGPFNIRRARGAERTHNSRRHHVESRSDEAPQSAGHSYRGSHRAERQHRAEDSAAHHRSSRVGRHHTGHW